MSILGHYNNFFFAAHLLDIAMGFKTLRTILSSVTHNGKQVRRWRRVQGFLHPAGVTAEPNLLMINNPDWLSWIYLR